VTAFEVTCQGEVVVIAAHCAARAAYRYVSARPALPSGTRLLVTHDSWLSPGTPSTWLLRVVRNRTRAGREYIQFRDVGAEQRARAFRAWWRARGLDVAEARLPVPGDGYGGDA
jgi:hypothetical protein